MEKEKHLMLKEKPQEDIKTWVQESEKGGNSGKHKWQNDNIDPKCMKL